MQDRKIKQIESLAENHLFARRILGRNCLGEKLADFRQHGQHLELLEEALRRLDLHEGANPSGNVIQRIDLEGQLHAPLAAELVHQHAGSAIALHILEEQRRTTRRPTALAGFRNPVGDLSDLQDRINFFADAFELASLVKSLDPLPQVVVCQSSSPAFARNSG